jgi:MFS family permease
MARLPYKWIVAVVFVMGVFMDILDTTSVNVALPTLQREFNATTAQIEWVVLGYLLSLAVWVPASGWIGDRFGTKKVYLFALVMFTGASMLCGHFYGELKSGTIKKILFVATGALHSPTSMLQKETIPSIAHAVAIETGGAS